MKPILVLTHAKDDCAQMVTDHFERQKVDFVRFNTEEFQKTVKLTITLDSRGMFRGCYHFPNRNLGFGDIGAVWNRRIHNPEVSSELDNEPDLKAWMAEESLWGLNISFTLLNAPVVNPWEANARLKFNKWIQMKTAAELGLEIPLSRMTNNLSDIKDFWEATRHEMIFKKIRKGLFRMSDDRVLLVHTSRIPEDKFSDESVSRMRFCPMFLQKCIPKKYDVRSVVVGDNVFTTAIHSQAVSEGITDYRTAAVLGKLDQMKHERIELGEEVNKKLISYSRSFGLAFSVIDLVITPDDRIVFLEDNPSGQWAWLEHRTGAPISEAFAEYLILLAKE